MNKAITTAYDVHSKILEEIAGDHFHIGFYDSSTIIPGSDVHSAQTRTIEAALRFASASEDPSKKPRNILDVGSGIGGSTRYLASKYDAQAKGITLSPVEAERARVITASQGLESQLCAWSTLGAFVFVLQSSDVYLYIHRIVVVA
ncbi:probable tocopherol O-methyltransferase, chloroplastic [Coffea eugenioides]|uniref:probable tocopherol O-methyltransferase, chloroplastic n=1 Tax=Coffea eugenioides TaxID=49369 RepID=UPI000F60E475|nr:probable tocopherol O-methyltransferase, chloroplastic [Coffea eugenioides]